MGKNKDKGITREQLWKIWKFLGAETWQEILHEHKRHNHFIPAGRETLKGLCVHPNHQDTDPSFYIYVEKGYAKCFGGSCNYYESNPLRLLAYILDTSYSEALQFLQEHYKPPFIPKKALAELEAQRKNQELKQEIFSAAHQMMCSAINDPDNPSFAYAKKGLDWLINTRNIAKETLYALPIAIMPIILDLMKQVKKRYDVQKNKWEREGNSAIPEPYDFSEDVNNYLVNYSRDPVFSGGVLLPLHVTPREIGNFKLRSPDSSKKFTIIQDDLEETLGLYGLGWNRYSVFWGQDAGYAHIVEGEFDALSVMSRYVATNKVKFPIISAGGAGGAQYLEKCMKTSGISKIYLVGDAPNAKGNDVLQKWMEHLVELDVTIFTGWNRFPHAKDIDEAINTTDLKTVIKTLWDDQSTTFSPPWMWAAERATEELENVPEHDFRNRIEIAANHGKYLKHRLECEKFIEVLESNYNLNPNLLKREITSRDNTERGFIQRCIDALREFMFVVGTRMVNGSRNLILYDTINKRFSNIQIDNERSLVQELSPIVGTPIAFVEDRVGQPAFLEFPDANSEGLKLNKLDKQLRKYLNTAVIAMTQGAPDFTTATRCGQGYHRLETKKGSQEYVVCGSDVFRLEREGKKLQYHKLEGPAEHDLDIIFDVGLTDTSKKPAWYPGGLTIAQLEKGKQINLHQLYDDLVLMYTKCFRFKNHEITAQLLAALMLTYPIMDAFERPILMFITGDTNSGKSSLLSTFADVGYTGIRLLLASQGYETYTAAGIAGVTDCDSCLLALDEFESGDTERGMHVSRIMETYRGLIGGQTKRVKARSDGSAVTQYFRLPMIFSAIQGAERPQDLNRMLTIEMQKIPYKTKTVTVVQHLMGIDRLQEMAKEIAVGLYPHAMELAELEQTVSNEFINLQNELHIQIEPRLAASLFAPLSILKFLGKDWQAFVKQYVKEHEYTIQRTAATSETKSFLNAILYTASIPQVDGPAASIARLLQTPEERDDINTSSKGVFFDEKTKTLLILASQGVLLIPYQLRGRMTGAHLKSVLERHPAALKPSEIENSGILRRVGKYLGAGIHIDDVIVFDAGKWLDHPQEEIQGEPEKPQEEQSNVENETPDPNKDASDYDNWGSS